MIPIPRNSDPMSGSLPGTAARASVVEPQRLPAGTAVGSFVLQKVQAHDEFSLRYLATASASAVEVTIEEFAPAGISLRDAAGTLHPRSPAHAALWEEGLQAYLQESELLARPLHPALVRIGAVWQLRGTAYRLWPRVEGRTLAELCAAMSEPPTEDWLRRLLMPLLDALESLHEAGWVHGNVCPGQILVQADGAPMLLDTAAVRTAIGSRMPQRGAWPQVDFRPPELTEPPGEHAAGPWSDLYSLAAVARFCMNGPGGTPGVPQQTGPLAAGRYASGFVAAFERALAPDPRERPQSAAAFRQQLQGPTALRESAAVVPERRGLALSDIPVLTAPFHDRDLTWPARGAIDIERGSERPEARTEPKFHGGSPRRHVPARTPRRWPWAIAGVLAVLMVAAVALYQLSSYPKPQLARAAPASLPSAVPLDQAIDREPPAAGAVPMAAASAAAAPASSPGLVPLQPVAPQEAVRQPDPGTVRQGQAITKPPVASERPQGVASAPGAMPSPPSAAVAARREAVPDSPSAACTPRTNFALYRCMQGQCEQSRFYAHPQCVRLRQRDELPS
ncbi:serine/threonine protein kinase [Methylibium sp.]|uniref:serine/threonine protein kinase n=1 Tax=Methylibium sp. TaxID=2067992 RepID=UPI003D09935D